MLVRIVKMTFREEAIDDFLELFEENKSMIRNFKGCLFLELYQDKAHQHTFFTYSHWINETHLQAYRNSTLFKKVWSSTKLLFDAKPKAWSLAKIESTN